MRSNWGSGARSMFTPYSLGSIPVVRGILIACAAVMVMAFLTSQGGGNWLALLGFAPSAWLRQPWSLLTYPFLVTSLLTLVFQGFWLYIVGGTLERSWGSRNFAALFFIWTAICGVVLLPVYYLSGGNLDVPLSSLVLPNTCLTVAWAALDPDMELLLYGLIPVRAKWLALIDVGYVFFTWGYSYGIPMSLMALAGPAAAYYYVRKMPRLNLGFRTPRSASRPRGRAPLLREEDGPGRERVTRVNPFAKKNEQQEIERLKRLLGEDDDNPRAPRR